MSAAFNKIAYFYRRNWLLLPLIVFGVGSLGRGVENSLLFVYWLFGIFSLLGNKNYIKKIKDERSVFIILVFLYLSWFCSLLLNDVVDIGFKEWLIAFLSSFVIYYVLAAADYESLLKQMNSLTIYTVLLLVFLFYISKLSWCLFLQEGCALATTINSMVLPIIFAFLFLSLYGFRLGRISFFIIIFIVYVLIYFSDSRTELLMFLSGLAISASFYYKKMVYLLGLAISLVLVIVLAGRNLPEYGGDVYSFLNIMSSYRLNIWANVVNNPPSNIFFGTGMNNTMSTLPDIGFGAAIHNAYLEIWYENGLLGFILWLVLFSYMLKNVFRVFRLADGKERVVYSAFIGGLAAVCIAGVFDKGYMSIYMRFVLPFYLVLLYSLGKQILSGDSFRGFRK